VFTALIEALGVKDVQVDEIWDLEGESLLRLQYINSLHSCLYCRERGKVYGVVFLFKYSSPTGETPNVTSGGIVDYELGEQIFFAQQVLFPGVGCHL
jgi:hypothetical protein